MKKCITAGICDGNNVFAGLDLEKYSWDVKGWHGNFTEWQIDR